MLASSPWQSWQHSDLWFCSNCHSATLPPVACPPSPQVSTPKTSKSLSPANSPDFSQSTSCHRHVATAGAWEGAQDLSTGRGLGGQTSQLPTGQDTQHFTRKVP